MRRRCLHSDWIANQDVRVVNGSLALPLRMSRMEACRTTNSSVQCIKEHTWYVLSWQGGALGLEKSDGKMAEPETCLTDAWRRLTTERKVERRRLAENSPWHSFSNAWTQGLLSVNMQALWLDWMI